MSAKIDNKSVDGSFSLNQQEFLSLTPKAIVFIFIILFPLIHTSYTYGIMVALMRRRC